MTFAPVVERIICLNIGKTSPNFCAIQEVIMKKIYLSCDLEGIMGICDNRQRNMEGCDYQWGRKMLVTELNMLLDMLIEKGVKEFIINDAHDYMINLPIDELPPQVKLISGGHKTDSMMAGLSSDVDGAMFIGYHGKSSLSRSVLAHTYAESILKVALNGIWSGETTLNAAFCGARNIPLLLVSGDDTVAQEVKDLKTGTLTVITKEGISRTTGLLYHPDTVKQNYLAAVDKLMQTKVAPFKLKSPFTLDVTLKEPQMVDMALRIPYTKRKDDLTIRFVDKDYITVYRAFVAIQSIASNNYLMK